MTASEARRSDGGRSEAPPRLLALRVQGFKSFAERTNVEFGGGISAVVGPNGSGKSNLADALRWALGEQGRALRSRKAEDVIWAGSDRRAAMGMADVTLVIDNGDGLLPVDYQVLELGRRLYRSGENEYLLNKQRIRLRDLVDLLDAAHLADNAFLFIGQGMVDQALALRPEERRPLFEEVAGVRRHERRRRRAEEQLAESESNLARVEDVLAELRPQVRRLAAQAERQATRSSIGEELAAVLLATGHGRWHAAAGRLTAASERRAAAEAETTRRMADLERAETAAASAATELTARAALERDHRTAHEAARAALVDLQLQTARVASESEAAARDLRRLEAEVGGAEAEIAVHRRAAAAPVPARDLELEAVVSEAERALHEATTELATLRTASQARGEALAALRRAEAARAAEADTARRRLAESERRSTEARAATEATAARQAEVGRRWDAARRRLEAATAGERAAAESRKSTRSALDAASGRRTVAADRLASASASAASLHGTLDALAARLDEDERRPIAQAARRAGGRRIDDDLTIEPGLRPAVEAALATRARAYVVGAEAVVPLAGERGHLIVTDRLAGRASAAERSDEVAPDAPIGPSVRRLLAAVAARDGGRLRDAVRRDAGGAVRVILERTVWLPDIEACLAVQVELPTGWIAVTRDGSAVIDELGVALGSADPILERRAELDRLRREVAGADGTEAQARREAAEAEAAVAAARVAMETARLAEAEATAERRRAEEDERAVGREAEAAARELAWHDAQRTRLDQEVARLTEAVHAAAPGDDAPALQRAGPDGEGQDAPSAAAAIASWTTREVDLRARRDRLAAQLATHEAMRRDAEATRARAEAAAAAAEDRRERARRSIVADREHEATLAAQADDLRASLAAAATVEADARAVLVTFDAADAADRTRLADAEAAAATAREQLRASDGRARAAEHEELEARLGLESLRESLLVELAGLGELGLRSLGVAGVDESSADAGESDPEASALQAALAAAADRWAVESPPAEIPAPGRLAQLRRRFHEVGAVDAAAVEDHASLRARLESLERQDADLRAAIGGTRQLIAELETMIADQFSTTFRALEAAFVRRFEQLFGGGQARLSLTDPSDLGNTGVEIVARPPGKKPQALAMLSGGERALTAVALLFAMLEVRPVPFCVLDEVDAALDEANIGRFADALRSLSDRTQFVVITHNRGTIEAADALYGVTVGDDSVSRVISLRLEEAQALADDRRRELAPAG